MRVNLFSASECNLARSRVQSLHLLKTLFLLEHLPQPQTHSESLRDNSRLNCMCSALYSNALEVFRRFGAPHGGPAALQAHYPIYFVVKHPWPSLCRKPSPEALETCPWRLATHWTCFLIGAASRRLRSGDSELGNLVELSGIEPLTPCLQSRCSPS